MEFIGHQKAFAFAFLLATGMIIKAFISDRHLSIAKWMRVECPRKCNEMGKPVVDHFFDLWHIGKSKNNYMYKHYKKIYICKYAWSWLKTVAWYDYKLILISLFFHMLEIQNVLNKLSKEKGCEVIGRWRKACVRHFYWAVTSTQPTLGDVILAKFKAFLSHVINKHRDLPSRLFNKCAHDEILTPRVWMTKGNF